MDYNKGRVAKPIYLGIQFLNGNLQFPSGVVGWVTGLIEVG